MSSLVPTVLGQRGIGSVAAGYYSSIYTIGNLVACFVAPLLAKKLGGTKRTVLIFALLAAVFVAFGCNALKASSSCWRCSSPASSLEATSRCSSRCPSSLRVWARTGRHRRWSRRHRGTSWRGSPAQLCPATHSGEQPWCRIHSRRCLSGGHCGVLSAASKEGMTSVWQGLPVALYLITESRLEYAAFIPWDWNESPL